MNVFESREGIFNIYYQNKDMGDFLNSQGKLEPPSLKNLHSEKISYHNSRAAKPPKSGGGTVTICTYEVFDG